MEQPASESKVPKIEGEFEDWLYSRREENIRDAVREIHRLAESYLAELARIDNAHQARMNIREDAMARAAERLAKACRWPNHYPPKELVGLYEIFEVYKSVTQRRGPIEAN